MVQPVASSYSVGAGQPIYGGRTRAQFTAGATLGAQVAGGTLSALGTFAAGATLGAVVAGGSLAGQVAATGTPQPFTLTSSTSGTLPFCVGYALRQGDVPAGSDIAFSGATAKAAILNTWPDGSAKFALIAGTYTSAGSPVTVTPSAGTNPVGTALTGAAVQSAMGANTAVFDCGAFGTVTFSGPDFASPFYTHGATSAFGEFIYRKQVGSDGHLAAWIAVRLWSGGAVEVLPWIENGYLLVASPTNKSATYTFTLGGTERFSAAIDVKHHTRVPLLTGSVFSYWLGADPGVIPAHDGAYLRATKLVPNYGYLSPTGATLDGLQQTYTPNTLAGVNSAMGSGGSSAALIPRAQALYVTSNGDARAYRAAMVFGFSGGSWSTHYRDESTNAPLAFASHANTSFQDGTQPPSGTGGENGSAVTTHQPSYGYLPFLMTGWFWFWEESAFWCTWNFLKASRAQRYNGNAIADTRNGTYANRGAAWTLRTLAQTLALCPSGHGIRASLISAWEQNCTYYRTVYVDGGSYGGDSFGTSWVSPQGFLGDYASGGGSPGGNPNSVNAWFGSAWMSTFGVQTWAFATDLGLPISDAARGNQRMVTHQAFKQVIHRAQPFNWRRFVTYQYPVGEDHVGVPMETLYTAEQSLTKLEAGYGLSALTHTEGLSLKQHGNDSDISSGTSSALDYGSFSLSALAFAVDHYAHNSEVAMQRIAGASNFSAFDDHLRNNPEHGILPRRDYTLPAYVPVAGSANANSINLNTLSSVDDCPSGTCWWSGSSRQRSAWRNWTGASHNWANGDRGSISHWGGGHGGGDNHALWDFDLNSRLWRRIGPSNPPTDYIAAVDAPGNDWNDYLWEGSYIVPSLHTYNYPAYVPPGYPGAGTKGQWILPHLVGGPNSGGKPHAVDLSTGVWTRATSNFAVTDNGETYSGSIYDSKRGRLYWAAIGAFRFNRIDFNDPAPRAVSQVTITGGGGNFAFGGYYARHVYVPEADMALGLYTYYAQTNIRGEVFNFASGNPVSMGVITSSLPVLNFVHGAGFGFDWCPITRAFYLYEGRGTATVYKLTPSTLNFATCTWTLTTESFSNPAWDSVTGNTALGPQPMSRWRYIPWARAFGWSDGPDASGVCVDGQTRTGIMQLWRPAGT